MTFLNAILESLLLVRVKGNFGGLDRRIDILHKGTVVGVDLLLDCTAELPQTVRYSLVRVTEHVGESSTEVLFRRSEKGV